MEVIPAIDIKADTILEETPEEEKPETEPEVEPEADPETEEAEADVEEPAVEEEVFQETEEADPELGESNGPAETKAPTQDRKLHEYACKACGNMFNDPTEIEAGEDEPPLKVCPNCESPNFS